MKEDQEGAIAALKTETVLNHWLRIMQEMEDTRREITASVPAWVFAFAFAWASVSRLLFASASRLRA